jgi:hypothetical protein
MKVYPETPNSKSLASNPQDKDDSHWEAYKDRWCVAQMAVYSGTFVPCVRWGDFPEEKQRYTLKPHTI